MGIWETMKHTMVNGLVKEILWNWKSFECVSYAPNIGLSSKAFQFQFSVQPFLGLVVFALSNQEDDWKTPRIGWDHEMVSGWTYQKSPPPFRIFTRAVPLWGLATLGSRRAAQRHVPWSFHRARTGQSRCHRAIMSHQYMWHHEIQELEWP